jgi:YbgC/YbaW family acyl-CoA thioester hydrolase
VFNVNYFNYFDVAMTKLHRHVLGRYSALVEDGAEMVVAAAQARLYAPASLDDQLDLEVLPVGLGATSLTVSLAAIRDEERLVEGKLRYVFIDPATKKKRPVPDEVRASLESYLPPEGEAGPAARPE